MRNLVCCAVLIGSMWVAPLRGQSGEVLPRTSETPGQPLVLTIDNMVALGLRDSYRVRQLQLAVERTRSLLNAERASLRSRVQLVVNAPTIEAITENKWNSTLQRNELIAENTRRVQTDFSIRQPVVLLGYPTNGVLSFNNRVYRYTQIDGNQADTRFYNRYFFAYDQPLFQPNRMKNDLERAELNLEDAELDYQDDVVGMIDDLADDYYELVESAYRREINDRQVAELETAMVAARALTATDTARGLEAEQVQVALANAREDFNRSDSDRRLQEDAVRQRLQLPTATALQVSPVLDVRPVSIDEGEAMGLARNLAPRMRQLSIGLRENEIRLDETKGTMHSA